MKCRAKVQKINETTTLFCFFYIKKRLLPLELVTISVYRQLVCYDRYLFLKYERLNSISEPVSVLFCVLDPIREERVGILDADLLLRIIEV